MSREFSPGVACDQCEQLIRAEEIFYNEMLLAKFIPIVEHMKNRLLLKHLFTN